jgi:vacuolar-type H+-ATPase subunit I/STV1
MKNSTLLEKIKALLSNEIKLEQMLMGDGVTKIEADSFEAGKEVFVVTEDEQKIAVPVGEYELEDGRILVIVEEGIISEVKEKEEEVEEVEEEVKEEETTEPMPEEEMSAPVSTPKKTIESIVKETFFSEMEKLKEENEALKSELAKLSKVDEVLEEKTELSETPEPIAFNPENEAKADFVKIGAKAPRGIMDSVLNKMYK